MITKACRAVLTQRKQASMDGPGKQKAVLPDGSTALTR
jgi:hypothetical protein